MNILMFGGSGIISSAICKRAIALGHNVAIFNRGKRIEEIHPDARLIIGDLRQDSIDNILAKLDSKYDVIVDFISYNPAQLEKTISISQDRCKQFIFISSATVYDENNKRYSENDPIGNTEWNYAEAKAECEKLIRGATLSCQYTIVRPYVTYGHTRLPFQITPLEYYTIINRIKNHKPIVVCNKGTKCTLTNAGDFAIAMCGLFLNEYAYGETFHITGDYETTWGDILEKIAYALGEEASIVDIPKDFMKKHRNEFGMDIDEIIYDKGRNMLFDNSKIKKVVPEFTGRQGFDTHLADILLYFEKKEHQKINYFWDAGCDRMIEVYARQAGIPVNRIDVAAYKNHLSKEQIRQYQANRTKVGLLLFKVKRKLKHLQGF